MEAMVCCLIGCQGRRDDESQRAGPSHAAAGWSSSWLAARSSVPAQPSCAASRSRRWQHRLPGEAHRASAPSPGCMASLLPPLHTMGVRQPRPPPGCMDSLPRPEPVRFSAGSVCDIGACQAVREY